MSSLLQNRICNWTWYIQICTYRSRSGCCSGCRRCWSGRSWGCRGWGWCWRVTWSQCWWRDACISTNIAGATRGQVCVWSSIVVGGKGICYPRWGAGLVLLKSGGGCGQFCSRFTWRRKFALKWNSAGGDVNSAGSLRVASIRQRAVLGSPCCRTIISSILASACANSRDVSSANYWDCCSQRAL